MKLWHDARQLNAVANALIALTIIAVLATAIARVVALPAFALKDVSIEAAPGTELRHVSSAQLRALGGQRLEGGFFTVDLDTVRAAFEAVPWVRRATVRRDWPDRLRVLIEEHRPTALWGDGRLLNTHGELFVANLDEAEENGPLFELSGPSGSESMVLSRYGELRKWLAPLGRRPVAVSLSSTYAWSARLEDGTTLLLGREQGIPIETRVTRWVNVFPRVSAMLNHRPQVVDLRYPNGFAVDAVAASDAGGAPGARTTKRP